MKTSDSVEIERTSVMREKLTCPHRRGKRVHSCSSTTQPLLLMLKRPSIALRFAVLGLLLPTFAERSHAQGTPAVSVIPYPASATVDSSVRYVFGASPVVALSAPANAE